VKNTLFTLLIILVAGKMSFAQTDWTNKQVGDKLFVQFPAEPTYKLQDKSGIYTVKTINCVFMVIVSYDVIPHYAEFLKLSRSNQINVINHFLNGVINGKLNYSNNQGLTATPIKVGQYYGREVSYNAINPITGEIGKRFSKVFLANNKVYSFECWYITSPEVCKNDKNQFLNSITIN
jgi:hypothetical protein